MQCAILWCNLGTPEAPTPAAVRRYLAEFLSDPRVVEIPRDACPLVDALLQPNIKLMRDVSQPELIEGSEQRHQAGHARQPEPDGLVVRRGDGKVQECAGFVPHAVLVGRAHA